MSTPIPPEWRTHAEATDYRETPNYDDTVVFAAGGGSKRFVVRGRARLRGKRSGVRKKLLELSLQLRIGRALTARVQCERHDADRQRAEAQR